MSTMNPDGHEMLEVVTQAELEKIDYKTQLLYAHNFKSVPKDTDFGDNRFKDQSTNYYCWRGITEIVDSNNPNNWILAEQCDPDSYTNARTRFCITFGCLQPYRYAAPLESESQQEIPNERGGIVVRNNIEDCSKGGTGTGFLNCLLGGAKESLTHATMPEHQMQNILGIGGIMITLMALAWVLRVNKVKIF